MKRKKFIFSLLPFALVVALLFSACSTPAPAPGTSISDSTIVTLSQGDLMAGAPGIEKPSLWIAGNQQEVQAILKELGGNLPDPSGTIDFNKYFLVAAFRGAAPSSGYSIAVEKAANTERGVILTAALQDPPAGKSGATVISYPYHLFLVPRSAVKAPAGTKWVMLDQTGKNLAERTYPAEEPVKPEPTKPPAPTAPAVPTKPAVPSGTPTPKETDVQFETIAQGESHTADLELPVLQVAGSLDEAMMFMSWLNDPASTDQMKRNDFKASWIIAVARGRVPSSGYSINIEKISVTPQGVKVQVTLKDLEPGRAGADVISYPYHVVRVPKNEFKLSGGARWMLVDATGKVLAETIYPLEDKPRDANVRFENVAQGASMVAEITEADLKIAGSRDQIQDLLKWVDDPATRDILQSLDLNRYWVVAVTRGPSPGSGYSISVKDISLKTGEVQIKVELSDPKAGQLGSDVITYPYQIILIGQSELKVERGMKWTMQDASGKTLAEILYP